jgi:rSAM/selenodomain-associated transferase 1
MTSSGPPAARSCAIGVMAKAPVPGRCKTRLCPPLTPEQAAAMGAAFLRDTTEAVAAASRTAPVAGYVAYAPRGGEALFDGRIAAGVSLLLADGAAPMPAGVEGFGCCLLHAVQGMLAAGHAAACVLSADIPTVPARLLAEAARLLLAPGERAVLGPAPDGGYYLLGLQAAHAAMFADIAWSTATVADATRARARGLGLALVELESWYDVDDAPSLRHLLEDTAPGIGSAAGAAPASRAAIEALGLRRLLATGSRPPEPARAPRQPAARTLADPA